jgi:VWFA-related protein
MRAIAAGSVAAALAALALAPLGAQQSTRFQSGVNLLAIDALVVDRTGQPITGLTPADFVVKINNQVRKIVSADLVRHTTTEASAAPAAAPSAPRAVIRTPGRIVDNTRTIVIGIDEPSFLIDQIKPAARAAQAFIRKLDPHDMVGVYVYPYTKPALDMTHDHASVADKLEGVMGRRDRQTGSFNLSPHEIISISAGDKEVWQAVALKECPPGLFFPPCKEQVASEAKQLGSLYEFEGARRVVAISELIYSLGALPGRKTLVVLSAGLMSSSQVGGRPDFRSYMTRLGEQAARANVMLYLIHMDNSFEEPMSAARSGGTRPELHSRNSLADAGAWASGLERLAGETGGVYLPWKNGTGELVFDRVLRETTAYYLLGVEPVDKDWDGRTLLVNVKTTVKGATVRALRQVIAK